MKENLFIPLKNINVIKFKKSNDFTRYRIK